MKDTDKKLAEEILEKHYKNHKKRIPFFNQVYEAMEQYHDAKMKEITDEDIKAWAEEWTSNADGNILYEGIFENFKKGIIEGAKAFRNGEIKHQEK